MSLNDFIYRYNHELLFACTFVGVVLFLLLDDVLAPSTDNRQRLINWGNNFLCGLLNFYFAAFFVPVLSVPIYTFFAQFVTWTPPLSYTHISWVYLIVPGILLMDFVAYWVHRLSHHWGLFWRLHAVHHSPVEFDPTITLRHHPLAQVMGLLLSAPIFVVIGLPLMTVIWYPLIAAVVQAFNHSHMLLPEWLDRYLRYIIVTPNFHRVHHSSNRFYTNSNYGPVFPFFDYLFGTAKWLPNSELREMEIGLEYLREPGENRIDRQLTAPFRTGAFQSPAKS